MNRKSRTGIGAPVLALCLALCLLLPGCQSQERASESQIAVFRAYLQSEWERYIYKDAVYDIRDYDAFLADYDTLTYEIWQSQATLGKIYTYTKLVGIDMEKYDWIDSEIWARWYQKDDEWSFVEWHEPVPADNVYLVGSFSVELPERAMRLPGGGEVDEAVYDAMTAALEDYYAGMDDRPLTAFFNTKQLYAVVVTEKDEEYKLTEYDQYQCYFVLLQVQEDASAGLTLQYAPQPYGIDYKQIPLLDLCDDMAQCNAVYSFR